MNGADPTNESTVPPVPPSAQTSPEPGEPLPPRTDAEALGEVEAPVEAGDSGPIEQVVDATLRDATGTEPMDDQPEPATLESDEGEPIEEEEVVEVDDGYAQPVEMAGEDAGIDASAAEWYILKVQVNREDSIKDGLLRRVKMHGMEAYFHEVIVPTEDVAEFTKTGKRRVVKRKIYPGYILVKMVVTDETWSLVRETSGIGDFTGAGGKPTPMDPKDVEKILRTVKVPDETDSQVRTAIPFKVGDRVRVKEGYFQNFEGDIDSVDEVNGHVTVMINIFGRSTPVELQHWQIEAV
jgi:transcription termination/antitermination protein NusG